jgi:hypothetical protein
MSETMDCGCPPARVHSKSYCKEGRESGPIVHELKTWPEPFAAVLDGRKRYEIRKDDCGFAVGDVLHLREWVPGRAAFGFDDPARYTGRSLRAHITYKSEGGTWGLPADVCVLSISVARHTQPTEER